MDKKSIRGLTPQQKASISYQLPDEESYLEVLDWRDRVRSKNEKFELSKIDNFIFNATIIYVGEIVLFFTWTDGLLRFHYCETKEIVEAKYVERLSNVMTLPSPPLHAGVEWDVIKEAKGLVAYARTPLIGKIEASQQTVRFCDRFNAIAAQVKSKKSEASKDEDGVFSLALHPIPEGGPK